MLGDRRVALTLSGGGFRATLFHLGVIRFLYDSGLLREVRRISAVSGGSVLGAHLVLNWERYTRDPVSFDSASQEIVEFVRSDVRGRVIRRWILSWLTVVPRLVRRKAWTFTNLLQAEYRRLYNDARLKDLSSHSLSTVNRPDLYLNCTSLSTGSPCCFGPSGFIWRDGDLEKTIAASETELSFAVAASSAFPPLFPPIAISNEVLACDRKRFPNVLYLTDGGVYDNLGIERLFWREKQVNETDLFLISDAEGNFDWNLEARYTLITSRNIRASNLIMKRVSELEYASLSDVRYRVVPFRIGAEIHEGSDEPVLAPEIQRCLRNIRTDLDSFSASEINCLIQHGYAVARDAATANDLIPGNAPTLSWKPAAESVKPSKLDLASIRRAQGRRFRLWSHKDWVSWVTLGIVLAACFFVGPLTFRTAKDVFLSHTATIGDERSLRFDLNVGGDASQPTFSPNGLLVAFVSKGQLALLRLDQDKPILLKGTEGGEYPFFSPDGRWLAFFAAKKLKKMNIEQGGPPIPLCLAPRPTGGTWNEKDEIIVQLSSEGGLSRVSAQGGDPEPLTYLTGKEDSHRWPQALPGGAVLFTATTPDHHAALEILPPGGRQPEVIVKDSNYGRYVKSGYLVYCRAGTLYAHEFDLNTMRMKGSEEFLTESVSFSGTNSHADFDLSNSGTLIYRRDPNAKQKVVWLDSTLKSSPVMEGVGNYSTPRLSPNDERLALAVQSGGQQNLYVYDLRQKGQPDQRTFDLGPNMFPMWTPDGKYLVFESKGKLECTRAEGGGAIYPLTTAGGNVHPWSISSDGKLMAFGQSSKQSAWELRLASINYTTEKMGIEEPRLVDLAESGEKVAPAMGPAISPDKRWLAYASPSKESARYEVYVTPLSEDMSHSDRRGKWRVSSGGGLWPKWGPNNQLFYQSWEGLVMVVDYTVTGETWLEKKNPRPWSKSQLAVNEVKFPAFDVAHHSNRVLALLRVPDENAETDAPLRVMLNVDAEIRRRLVESTQSAK